MIYATPQDIIDRYNEETLVLVFDRQRLGAADPVAVAKALADASAELDSYLAGSYPLPLAIVPPALAGYCVDIALYRGTDGPAVPEERRKRYDDAIRWAIKVGEGKIKLPMPVGAAAPASVNSVQIAPATPVFTRESLERF